MSGLFEELDYQQTALGELILRRRKILKLDRDVVEVIPVSYTHLTLPTILLV